MSARPKTPTHADEKHAILYGHPIPENSFAVRDLVHKLPGVGPVRPAPHRGRRPRLHLLRRLPEGVPGGLHRRAPRPLALARQGQGAPLRRHDHPRRAALHDLQPLHGGLQVRRARAHRALRGAPPPRAGAGARDAAALQRPRPLQRLRRLHRRQPGAEPGEEPLRRLRRHRLPRGLDDALPVHRLEGQLHPHQLRERRGHALRRRDRLPRPVQARQARGARQVHRLRRRRRHLRHRPAGALRRHGARPRHALRVLRQRRLHEHRLPALERDAARRLDDHQPGRRGAAGQARPQQEPHRDHGGPPPALRGPVLAARPAGPHCTRPPRRSRSRVPPSSTCSPPARAAGAPTTTRASTSCASPPRPATGRCSRSTRASTASPTGRGTSSRWASGWSARAASPTWRSPATSTCWRRSRSGSTSSGTCCCASATRSPRTSGTRRAAATRPSRS